MLLVLSDVRGRFCVAVFSSPTLCAPGWGAVVGEARPV